MGYRMALFTPENADLLAGQREGYQVLESNTGTQVRDVGRLMDRYGTANADYYAKMVDAQKGAEAAAKLRLDARLADSQMRSRIHQYKLDMLKKAYKQQEKDQRRAMYGQLIGMASSMAPGVYDAAKGLFATNAPGPMSYTPQSEIYRPSPYSVGGESALV